MTEDEAKRAMSVYRVERRVNGEWALVKVLDWLAAQRLTDRLQNEHGANYVRMVKQ